MSVNTVDMHFHVGLLGDEYPNLGYFSESFQNELAFKIFLLYGRLKPEEVSDCKLREKTEEVINECSLKNVVCLALDPVYSADGQRREDLSNMWVNNDYILELKSELGDKVLLGASVHPYDPDFNNRVSRYVDEDAVLLKWVPSSQQINLADDRVRDALIYLATAKDGKPLPLLLHVGMEYAIPTTIAKTQSYDFLCWNFWDILGNIFRGSKRWHKPDLPKIHNNLKSGIDEGAIIIFAHCGLPYYAPSWIKSKFEHSDFEVVRDYLLNYPPGISNTGCCFADVSACVTPFRKSCYPDIRNLPEQSLFFGSDFPTPVFELSANLEEMLEDLGAVLNGEFERIIIPEDNLLDVNYYELLHFFGDHPLFTNFNRLLTSN